MYATSSRPSGEPVLGEEGIEYEVTLYQKLPVNSISFPLNALGLLFTVQRPLTEMYAGRLPTGWQVNETDAWGPASEETGG